MPSCRPPRTRCKELLGLWAKARRSFAGRFEHVVSTDRVCGEGHGIRCQSGSGNRGEMHDRGHVPDPIIDLGKCFYRLAEVRELDPAERYWHIRPNQID